MIQITIRGTYRVKVAFDLFGNRITLWSKKGSFNETIDLGADLNASRRHDFGAFEAFLTLDEKVLSMGITARDGLIELWSHKWPLSEAANGKPTYMNIKAKGLEVKATVSLNQETQAAA